MDFVIFMLLNTTALPMEPTMMGVIILTALTVLVVSLGLFLVFKVFGNYRPGKRRVQQDLQKMRDEVEPWVADLVPISREELELFSQGQINQAMKKRVTTSAKGVFTTIYNEPIVAYNFKRYIAKDVDAILYARTATHEFAYRIKGGEVKVVIDNELVGTLKENGVLYGGKRNRMIARINREAGLELMPIIVNEKEVGNLTKALPAPGAKSVDARAFEFVRDDLDGEEKKIFLSLAIYELVQRNQR